MQSIIENMLCECLLANAELSGDDLVNITSVTIPTKDMDGFDSLRMIEVMVSIEEILDVELTPEKIFGADGIEGKSVCEIANLIENYINEVGDA